MSAPLPPPAGPDAPGLPPLPAVSPRNASYTIDARLDPEKHTIKGSLVLEWRNTSDRPLSTFPFHLYWNAFRNNLSTTARGEGRRAPDDRKREDRSYGWIQVRRVQLTGPDACGGGPHAEPALPRGGRQRRRPHGDGGRERAAGRAGRDRPLPRGVGRPRAARQRWPRGLGPRLQLRRAVVPEDRRLLEGGVERAPVLPVDRVLLRLRSVRRPPHAPEGIRGRRDRPPRGEEGQRRRQRDLPLRAGGRSRLRVDREPAVPGAEEPFRGRGLPAGGRAAPPAAGARAPRRAVPRGDEDRAAHLRDLVGAVPLPRRSRSSTRRGARPRAEWSTRRSSPGAPPSSRPRRCRAPRASRSTRRDTSSGTGSWRTTSSRRRGSTRASTPT